MNRFNAGVILILITCSLINSLYTCYGVPSSSELVCSGRGKCLSKDNCACSTNYTGVNCELENRVFQAEILWIFPILLTCAVCVILTVSVIIGVDVYFYCRKVEKERMLKEKLEVEEEEGEIRNITSYENLLELEKEKEEEAEKRRLEKLIGSSYTSSSTESEIYISSHDNSVQEESYDSYTQSEEYTSSENTISDVSEIS